MNSLEKKNKTVFKWFTIADYEEEGLYLSQQHRQGWRLTGIIFPGFYNFTKCEPEDVRYQLDYNQVSVANKTEYLQMFRDCGWEYLINYVGFSYFRKPYADMRAGDEGIFSDDESKLEMVKRIIKGRLLPLLIIFCCIILPQLFLQFRLDGTPSNSLLLFFIGLFIAYMVIFIHFCIIYSRLKRRLLKY